MKREIIETDVLCVGGGIAGLMAAIRASELGAKVVVAEKANPARSGSAAVGCDHFRCYIPEVHGDDITPNVEQTLNAITGFMRDRKFVQTWMEKSFDIIKLWDSWGIPMKYQGRWEFAGHALPGGLLACLKYSGKNQKPILTKEALSRGVQIMDRVMVFDLLGDGSVKGAIGINTREEKFIEFHAKSVVLGTGLTTRLFPGPTPGWMFNLAYSPNNTGDGRGMAYRAGAEIANAELTMSWSGPKPFARCGKGTWVGVLRDPQGRPVGPFVTKPEKRYGDVTSDIWNTLFEDYSNASRGPVYMDCAGITEEDFEYMMYWMRHEGNDALLNHLAEEGRDLRDTPVEFMTYEMMFSGGVRYNEKGETSLAGLYAAGDEFFGAVSCAATFGWIAGENAAMHADLSRAPKADPPTGEIEERSNMIEAIPLRESGASWQEVNIALQEIMKDYAGAVRNDTLLEAGLGYLMRLKDKACHMLSAKNQHELMHCLEVLNLLDLAELVFVGARERKETRNRHVRNDYPFTNPLLGKMLIVKQVGGKPVTSWMELKR
ncbi:MAG: FAD-binding protein [Deltaproteobacteria bacterium]|nr:FAD-binding protein [Deltaproteobacteria bacterium]